MEPFWKAIVRLRLAVEKQSKACCTCLLRVISGQRRASTRCPLCSRERTLIVASRHLTTHAFGQQHMPLDKGTADSIDVPLTWHKARGYGVSVRSRQGFRYGFSSAASLTRPAQLVWAMQFAAMTGRLRIDITEELARLPDTLTPIPQSARPLNGCYQRAAGGWRRRWPNALKRSSKYSNSWSV
jgi:hypothetical protein